MSKQKIMYIIAIVLLAGGLVNKVSAVTFMSSSNNEVEGAVRNDTLSVDAAVTQQNTEKEVEKISQAFGTGDVLASTIDALVSGTIDSEISADSEQFCNALDSVLMKQTDSARASLAWNPTSYQKNIKLKYQGADGSQASLHESTQNAYESSSMVLKSLSPRSDKAIDSVMLSRFQAITRSALVEMNMALKAKEINSERVEGISQLLSGSLKCVESYTSSDEQTTAQFASVKTALGEVLAGWDANKNSFGVESGAAVKEPFYLKVSSKDVVEEDESALTDSKDVVTKADLESYIRSILRKDSSIKDITVNDDSVTLKYATKGKLFGFVPVWLTPKTTVTASGDVNVKYPWFSALSSKKSKILEDSLKNDLVTLGLISETSPEMPAVEMSMQYRARLIETLDTVIKSGLETPVVEEAIDSNTESQEESEVLPSEEVPASEGELEAAPQA